MVSFLEKHLVLCYLLIFCKKWRWRVNWKTVSCMFEIHFMAGSMLGWVDLILNMEFSVVSVSTVGGDISPIWGLGCTRDERNLTQQVNVCVQILHFFTETNLNVQFVKKMPIELNFSKSSPACKWSKTHLLPQTKKLEGFVSPLVICWDHSRLPEGGTPDQISHVKKTFRSIYLNHCLVSMFGGCLFTGSNV